MNHSIASRLKPALLLEPDPAVRNRWINALTRNQFMVRTLPERADPLFGVALLDAAGGIPAVVIAALSFFAGSNRNPYQFAKRFTGYFPATSLMLVQIPGQPVTEAMRAAARRYGAVDLAPAAPRGDGAASVIETLRLSASVQAPRKAARDLLVLGDAQQLAVRLRRQLKVDKSGAFRAAEALACAEKLGLSRAALITRLDAMVKDGSLRLLSGEPGFAPHGGAYRFFTDEPGMAFGGGSRAQAKSTPAAPPEPRNICAIDIYQLAAEMRVSAIPLDIRDRSYRFKDYPACFVASGAIDWLVRHKGMTRPQSVRIGERMFESGLFHHVTDDHDFKDGNFYFRFFTDETGLTGLETNTGPRDIDTLNLQELAARMHGTGGLRIASKRYRFKTYPKCFSGTEAVDWLAANCDLSRPLAMKVGERLMAAGVLHHVADDHDFRDGEFFYRYYADE